MEFKEELMNQACENDKKNLILDQILAYLAQIYSNFFFFFFLRVLPLLVVRHCFKLISYAI